MRSLPPNAPSSGISQQTSWERTSAFLQIGESLSVLEGRVLPSKCVLVACVHARVGRLSLERHDKDQRGKALGSGLHPGCPWQWTGHSGFHFGSMCFPHTQNSGWRVQCVFYIYIYNYCYYYYYYFIEYFIGNFTLALTELAEATQAIDPGSKMNM